MVYKNKDSKRNKYYYKKLIFSLLLIIYITGLCTGCLFALKNTDNLHFVQKVMFIEKYINNENMLFSGQYITFLSRDLLCLIIITLLKYCGLMKGLCAIVPFVMSAQNAGLYVILMYKNKISFFKIIFEVMLKDTAVSFIIILYCYIIIQEIRICKENHKKDIKMMLVYISVIISVYVIDMVVKSFILPLH